MRRWKCHKVVAAAKILAIDHNRDGYALVLEGEAQPRRVSPTWLDKHNPLPGWYFVVYESGYESTSPSDEFEAGYALLEEPAQQPAA